jgi:hypothetical protein
MAITCIQCRVLAKLISSKSSRAVFASQPLYCLVSSRPVVGVQCCWALLDTVPRYWVSNVENT